MSPPKSFQPRDAFYRAVLPLPVCILGLQLRPFCAGHMVLLHTIESCFLVPGIKLTESGLALALAICSLDFRAGWEFLNQPQRDLDRQLHKWGRKVGKFDLQKSADAFEAYITSGVSFEMEFIPKSSQGNVINITELPLLQSVRATLKNFYHLSEAEFWDMPWALALWDFNTAPVLKGQADLVNPAALDSAGANSARVGHKLAEMRAAQPDLFDAQGGLTAAGRDAYKNWEARCRN